MPTPKLPPAFKCGAGYMVIQARTGHCIYWGHSEPVARLIALVAHGNFV